jgi:hypothetical protein
MSPMTPRPHATKACGDQGLCHLPDFPLFSLFDFYNGGFEGALQAATAFLLGIMRIAFNRSSPGRAASRCWNRTSLP